MASQASFEKNARKSRRELFLDEMEQVAPWSAMESLVRPHYAKAGYGRQPVKVMQGEHMSQLAAIQPPGRQFVQRGDPAGSRLGTGRPRLKKRTC